MAVEPGTQVEAEDRRGRERVAHRLARSAVPLVATFAVACAPTAAQKMEADIASVRKESDAKTLVERGKAFAAIGDHTRAEEYLASAIEAGAHPRDVLPLLMDVCVQTGRYRSAIQHGENHLRKHPHDMRTRVMVGALYAAINESKQAKEQLEQVIASEPIAEGEMAEGVDAQTSAPSSPGPVRLQAQAHYLLAVVARDTDNDVVGADRHFREYLRMDPNGSHAEEARASLLKRMAPQGTPSSGEKVVPGGDNVQLDGGTP